MAPSTSDAQRAAWTQGVLSWALRPMQRRAYDAIHAAWPQGRFLLEAHRRFGKDFIPCTIVSERCLQYPGARWLYVAPTLEQAGQIAQDQFKQLLLTCPPALAPKWVATRAQYEFPNGSIIAFHSAEPRNRHRMRGLRADGAVLSELRDMVGLDDLLGSVIGPALQYAPGGGMTIGETTPPQDEEAEYNELWDREAQIPGRTLRIRLSDNPDVDDAFRAQAARDCGGTKTPAYLCEYECQRVPALERLCLPNLPSHVVQAEREMGGWAPWTSIDPGGTDLTAILHGQHGPGGLHVQRNWAQSGVDLNAIVSAGRGLELATPRTRWFDKIAGSDILLRSLAAQDWRCIAATYGNPVDAVRLLRTAVDRQVVTIAPDCEDLLRTLQRAQWATTERGERKSSFRRMERSGIGHADLLAALLLAVCNSAHVRRALGPGVDLLARRKKQAEQWRKLLG